MNLPWAAHDIALKAPRYGALSLLDAWRRITRRQIVWTAIIGVLVGPLMLTVTHAFEAFMAESWSNRLDLIVQFFGWGQLAAFTFLLCIVAADHAVQRGAHRVKAYGLALFVGAVLYAAFQWSILYYVMDWFNTAGVDPGWAPVHATSNFLYALLLGGFATFAYADWQRARDSAARLHAAGLARTRAARDILQTRLQAMQARVDPQFLFETLARTRRLYDSSPERGEQTLDNLIAFLRIAMPKRLATASTLAREIDMARCYVAIVAGCSESKIAFAVDRDEEWTRTPFPPLLLLPLVEHAVKCSPMPPSDQNSIAIRITAGDANLQLAISQAGLAFDPDAESAAVSRVRERLNRLFEGRARFDLRKIATGGTEVVMEVPDERA